MRTCSRCGRRRRALHQPGAPLELSDYVLTRPLGEGAYGLVYAARDRATGAEHAVKLLPIDPADMPRIRREVRVGARVEHPNLVPIEDVIEVDGFVGLVMPLVAGPSLEEVLDWMLVSEDVTIRVFHQIVAGVAALHAAGVVHRDLKPGNVVLDTGQAEVTARVTDFGLAASDQSVDSVHTAAGVILGTPGYQSPEAREGRPTSAASDVYALGCLLARLSLGATPLDPSWAANAAGWVVRTVEACLRPDPALRPTAAALLDQLPKVRPDSADDLATLCRAVLRPNRFPAPFGAFADSGRYRRLTAIGRGGFGVVYRAWDVVYGTEVALKMMPRLRHAAADHLKSEFRRASDLSHPNLVAMYDLVATDVVTFFTMELVAGGPPDLGLPLPPDELGSFAAQALDALAVLHDAGLIHRDVKPSNLLVEPTGRVVLVDFGLAREWGASRATPGDGFRLAHSLGGTRSYLAPETLLGQPVTPAVDLFALGVTLFELARGAPWRGIGPPEAEDVDPVCGDTVVGELIRRCLAFDPATRPTAREARATLVGAPPPRLVLRPASGPFVGRAEETEALRGSARERGLTRVEGAPGMGKTRLVEHTLGGGLVGRCSPAESVPFNAFDRPLALLGLQARLDPAELAQELVAAWTRSHPTAPLWLDDVQWMDEDSLALLRALGTTGHPPIVVSHRPLPEGHRLLGEAWFTEVAPIRVAPLGPADVAELAAAIGATGALDRCEGSPLLVHRLARLGPDADASPLAASEVEPDDRPLAAELLGRAAVHGGPLPIRALGSDDAPPALPRVLTRLIRARVLTWATTDSVDFVHDSQRDQLLDGVEPAERVHHHRGLARAFERQTPPDSASVARHLAGAGDLAAARAPALTAAREAEERHAWGRAAEFYRLATRSEPEPWAPELVRDLARTLSFAGHAAEAGRLLRDRGAPSDRARAAELLTACGEFAEADAVLDRALADVGMSRPRSAFGAVARGVVTSVQASIREPRLAATRSARDAEVADVLWTLTTVLGQFDSGRTFAFAASHLLHAMRSGDPARAARALAGHLTYAAMSGASPDALERMERYVDALAAAAADPFVDGWVATSRAYRRFLDGDFLVALRGFDEVERHWAATGTLQWERTTGWNFRLFTLGLLGRHADLRRGYDEVSRRFRALGDRASDAMAELGAGYMVALADGDPDLAEARLDRGSALFPRPMPVSVGFVELVARVHVDLYRGRADRARAKLDEAAGLRRVLGWSRTPLISLAYLEGLTAPAGAERKIRAAAARIAKHPGPLSSVRGAALQWFAARSTPAGPAARDAYLAAARQWDLADVVDAIELETGSDPALVLARARARGLADPERYLRIHGLPYSGNG